MSSNTQTAIFAAGCFWGVQYYFDQVPGVVETVVGYTGGHTKNPTYEAVCSHTTGHAEAVEVTFDPSKVSYEVLVKQFFRMHDPTQLNRQGPDIGDEYRSAIFFASDEQKRAAEAVRNHVQQAAKKPIVTQIVPVAPFYRAEAEHQKFTERTGLGMCHVPYASVQ